MEVKVSDDSFETIYVNQGVSEEDISNSAVGVMELGKRLLLAAKEGNTALVRNLMKGGAPFATDWLGTTSLHAASSGGHLETCELLLRSGILKDARTKVEKTPLHMACQEGHSEVALLLLANGADVNATDMLLMTPLHWAVEKEKPETVRILLQNGADPTMVNKFDKTCFDIANDSDRKDIINLLFNEPRRGPYTMAESKNKIDLKLSKKLSPVNTSTPKSTIELVSVSSNKNVERPKTAIVLPTYQNKKSVTVSKKSVKGTSNEEEQNRLAALQLLEEHGIEMLEGEDINLVASAVGSGQTVVLTEAGKQALTLTEKGALPSKGVKRSLPVVKNQLTPKYIRINSGVATPVSSKVVSPKKLFKVNKAPTVMSTEQISLEDINKKFEEAKREAEQYKEMYARKQREAQEYKNKLETITRSSIGQLEESIDEEEDEDEDEEEEEDDEEPGIKFEVEEEEEEDDIQ